MKIQATSKCYYVRMRADGKFVSAADESKFCERLEDADFREHSSEWPKSGPLLKTCTVVVRNKPIFQFLASTK